MRIARISLLAVWGLSSVVACGDPQRPEAELTVQASTTRVEPAAAATSSTTLYTASEDWRALGDQIKKRKEANAQALPSVELANAGLYAFLSDPIDIEEPGTYVLDFQVTSDLNAGAIAYGFPPDTGFRYEAKPLTTPETFDGRSFQLEVVVHSEAFKPYPQWSVWIS
ncbi:MAG: hypothetical protein AB7W59_21005 [Acidimicrobiia bacterium]